jgi:protein transport protein SEC31
MQPRLSPSATDTRANAQVNSLAFNPNTPSMLACGTSSGEVLLYDISNPHEPRDALAAPDAPAGAATTKYAPHFRSGPGEVLSLKFNNVSPHIVAIGFASGATHLYDTRNHRKVLEFVDENLPRRIAGVAWSPSDETHLVLASEDDRSPTLQFWDLRKVCCKPQHAPACTRALGRACQRV